MIKPRTICQADARFFLERIESRSAILIYLDPPWFTREQSFIVSEDDRGNQNRALPELREYLSFISEVLQQCRRILDHQGSLVTLTNVWRKRDFQLLLDQTFGRWNFRNEFTWPQLRNDSQHSIGQAAILLYSKSDAFIYNEPTRPLLVESKRMLFNSDKSGLYRLVPLVRNVSLPFLQFEWHGYRPPPNWSWRYRREKLNKLDQDQRVVFTESTGQPRLKVYVDDDSQIPVGHVWDDIPSHNTSTQEIVGYFGQNPLALLDRILKMSTRPRDLVVDPFSGSGTSVISCEKLDRRWIACDSSSEAIRVTTQRLQKFGLQSQQDFQVADQTRIENSVPAIPFYYSPLVLPEDINNTPLIITGGKTDWKHMKAAFAKLRSQGHLVDFDVEFLEYEDEIPMGDGALRNLCKHLSKLRRPRKIVCIFDRDKEEIVKNVIGEAKEYKHWGNQVYSFAIPIPKHRTESEGICIELYYRDAEIVTMDREGRRLYLDHEFDAETGLLKDNPDIRYKYPGAIHETEVRIFDQNVLTIEGTNVALSKSMFAEYVLNGEDAFRNFDVTEFKRIFDIVVEIAML
jgi:DNA modification methylase